MEQRETFAPVRIDMPAAGSDVVASPRLESGVPETTPGPVRDAILPPLSCASYAKAAMPSELAIKEGEAYRMVSVRRLLETLGLSNEGDGYLDDATQLLMLSRLRRMGLTLATEIIGPLRLRVSDDVPIVHVDTPRPSRYSAVTVCLYLIAWMIEGNGATRGDLSIIDAWLSSYDPKAQWAPAAGGTLRWLLSRKLIFTAKRKQRLGRIKRYPKVRARLVDVLLRLVADPEAAAPRRMERLATIYKALDLDVADIHGDIHRMASAYPGGRETAGAQRRLRSMDEDTRKAQELLASVFAADEEAPVAPKSEKLEMQIIRRLGERSVWPRAEAQTLAGQYGMSLGAMLDRVNDVAYDLTGSPLADDDGEIAIDLDTLHKVNSNHKNDI